MSEEEETITPELQARQHEERLAEETDRLDPLAEPAEAVTVDVPGPTAVTRPESETVATPRSDAVQVIVSLLITFPC